MILPSSLLTTCEVILVRARTSAASVLVMRVQLLVYTYTERRSNLQVVSREQRNTLYRLEKGYIGLYSGYIRGYIGTI